MKPLAPALALALACAHGSQAQVATPDALDGDSQKSVAVKLKDGAAVGDLLKSLVVDMPVTTAPATFVLGAAGTQVPRVATFREMGAQIANAIGDDGKLKTSMAVEITPRLALAPVQWADYKASRLTQVLTRTTVSFATLTSPSETGARTAIGLQSVLYSAEVPELIAAASSGACRQIATDFAQGAGGTPTGAITPGRVLLPLPEASQKAHATCKARIEGLLTKWNPTSLVVGVGQSLYADSGALRDLKTAAGAAWITGTFGVDFDDTTVASTDRTGLGLTVHARRMVHERVADPADASVQRDEASKLIGLNLRVGSGRIGGLLELSRRHGQAATLVDERRKRIFAGLEYRLQDNLYLVAGVGSDRGRRDGQDERLTLVNLKWGFTSESVLR